jgi:hypothetical protein
MVVRNTISLFTFQTGRLAIGINIYWYNDPDGSLAQPELAGWPP